MPALKIAPLRTGRAPFSKRAPNQADYTMSRSDDEDVVASPELGAFKAKKVRDAFDPPSSAEDAGSGADAPESEEEEQPAEEEEQAKKRTRKKDTRP